MITKDINSGGYNIIYHCDKHGEGCALSLGTNVTNLKNIYNKMRL